MDPCYALYELDVLLMALRLPCSLVLLSSVYYLFAYRFYLFTSRQDDTTWPACFCFDALMPSHTSDETIYFMCLVDRVIDLD